MSKPDKNSTDEEWQRYFRANSDAILARWRKIREDKK